MSVSKGRIQWLFAKRDSGLSYMLSVLSPIEPRETQEYQQAGPKQTTATKESV